MAAPSLPYNIILAGKYGVGKSSLFNFLCNRVEKSIRGWDKCVHVINIGVEDVQVALWDTASMERNSVLSVSRSYFTQCTGVILVYKKGDLGSLWDLDRWWQSAHQYSEWNKSLVFSLWCNDMDSYAADEIEPGQKEDFVKKWKIPAELVFDVCAKEDDGDNVKETYRKVVMAVWEKCKGTTNGASGTEQGNGRHQSADSDNRVILPDSTANNNGNIQQPTPAKKRCFCVV